MKHCQGQKVRGQGHMVTRHISTKTSSISRNRNSVVEMHLSLEHRGRQSEWRGQIFDRKLLNSPQLACGVVKRHKFYPLYKKSWSLNEIVRAFLDRKQNELYFCACALKKSPKHSENVSRQKRFSPVTRNRRRRSEW